MGHGEGLAWSLDFQFVYIFVKVSALAFRVRHFGLTKPAPLSRCGRNARDVHVVAFSPCCAIHDFAGLLAK